MRYRIKEYVINLLRVDNIIQVGIVLPPAIFDSLTIDVDNDYLDNASKKFVTESVRLITDETRGGYVLMSTGQKGVIENIYKVGTQGLVLNISIPALIAAADGDADDLAAINAMANSDQFTIEMDWGDEPSGLSGGDAAEQVKSFFGIVKDGDTVKVVTEDGGEEVVEPVGLMDEDDVYDYLEDIAVLLGGITAEQAASITAATRAIIHGGSGSGSGE
jgi:hypothetical protein